MDVLLKYFALLGFILVFAISVFNLIDDDLKISEVCKVLIYIVLILGTVFCFFIAMDIEYFMKKGVENETNNVCCCCYSAGNEFEHNVSSSTYDR